MSPIRLRAPARLPFIQVLKTAAATVVAWVAATPAAGGNIPIFAVIAAILVVQASVNQSLARAVERSTGVILGVVVGFGAGFLPVAPGPGILIAVGISILLGWALRLAPVSASQVPISAMLVLALGGSTPGYAVERIAETLIGALVGIAVNAAIVPPVTLGPSLAAVPRLGEEIAAALDRLAEALSRRETDADGLADLLESARGLRPLEQSADEALQVAAESLTLNPRRSRHRDRLDDLQSLHRRLRPLVTQTIGMTRTVHDHLDEALTGDAQMTAIATELGRAAHDLRLLVARHAGPAVSSDAAPAEPPALTRPVRVLRPDDAHWLVVGALLEDLRRIREAILEGDDR